MLAHTLLFAAVTILVFGFAHAAASCEDASLSYGTSSACPDSGDSKEEKAQKTILRLFDIKPRLNEGDPIVFVGKLASVSGKPISNAKISILHDGACQAKVIGHGTTDKNGVFYVHSNAKVWDKKDNMVLVHAEFSGNAKALASKSEPKIVVVYPLQSKGCA